MTTQEQCLVVRHSYLFSVLAGGVTLSSCVCCGHLECVGSKATVAVWVVNVASASVSSAL